MQNYFVFFILFLIALSLIIYYNFEAFKTIIKHEKTTLLDLEQRINQQHKKTLLLQKKASDISLIEKTHKHKAQKIILKICEIDFSLSAIFKEL